MPEALDMSEQGAVSRQNSIGLSADKPLGQTVRMKASAYLPIVEEPAAYAHAVLKSMRRELAAPTQ